MALKRHTPEELERVKADHDLWLETDGEQGARANLSGSDLSYSDLSYSDLSGSNLYGANLSGSNLRGSNLSGSDLSGSNLSYSDLSRSDLRGSNLYGANLSGSDLRRSNLRGSNLSGSDLSGSDLSYSDLYGADLYGVKIKKATAFNGLYAYIAMPVIAEDDTEYVRLGCHFHKVSEWEENFWNNPQEFPDDGSPASQQRLMAYRTCLEWLRIHRDVKAPVMKKIIRFIPPQPPGPKAPAPIKRKAA